MKRLLLAALMSGCSAVAVYARAPAPVPPVHYMLPPTGRVGELVPPMKLDPANLNYASGTQTAGDEKSRIIDAGSAARPPADHLLPPTGRIGELVPPMTDTHGVQFVTGRSR